MSNIKALLEAHRARFPEVAGLWRNNQVEAYAGQSGTPAEDVKPEQFGTPGKAPADIVGYVNGRYVEIDLG